MGSMYNPHGRFAIFESKEEDFCPFCDRMVAVWEVFEKDSKWYKKCPKGHQVKSKKPKVTRDKNSESR